MAQRIYRVTALVSAPLDTVVGSDALSSGIMGAFEPNTPFELISHNVEPDPAFAEDMEELAELIAEAIDDSMDMDWRSSDGARAIVNILAREGYKVVQRGEDSDVAIAIGEDAFKGGWASGVAWAKSEGFHMPNPDVSVKPMFDAWSDYTPPEDLCGRALS